MSRDQNSQAESEGASEGSQSQAIPTIDLPRGGGAIRGIGEKFAANPVNGTGTMSVPIATSAGRGGFGPALDLSYDSGSGNGPFGFGWSLSLPTICRKTDKGLPQYFDDTESDVFLLSGAEDLVPAQVEVAPGQWQPPIIDPYTEAGITYRIKRYRPRIEGLFARIERWANIDDPRDVHWRSISRDNILSIYGKDINSRIVDSEISTRIFKWLICETRDDKGNAVIYQYKADDGAGIDLTEVQERNRGDVEDSRRSVNRYLKTVLYGNRAPLLDETAQRPVFLSNAQRSAAQWMFEVVFDYGEHDPETPGTDEVSSWKLRADTFSSYRPGFEVRTTRLCQRVLMFHHFAGSPNGDIGYDGLVRSTDFTYSHEDSPRDTKASIYTFLKAVTQSGYKLDGTAYLKRRLPPIAFEYSKPVVQSQVEVVSASDLENLPIGMDGSTYRWVDLHGEGTPGILTEQAGAWHYKRNLSPMGDGTVALAPLERVASRPNLGMSGGQAQIMDLAGDGQPDLVVLDDPMPGFYPHDRDEGWQRFRSFESRLNRDTRDPNLRFIDLDGDGHADVFITEDDAFVWHKSMAEAGFGQAQRVVQALDEEDGPRLIFAESTQSVFLADMSGDGLTDLVRVRNGDLCYWPNLGYGRFGAKITMGGSPHFDNPEQFDSQRLRLADIDGRTVR